MNPTHTVSNNDHSTTSPTHSKTLPESNPAREQPPVAIIIGVVIVCLVIITLIPLVVVLLVKYRQLRFGNRTTHLDNPTYQGEERMRGRVEDKESCSLAYNVVDSVVTRARPPVSFIGFSSIKGNFAQEDNDVKGAVWKHWPLNWQ